MKRYTERDEFGNADIKGVDSDLLSLNLDSGSFDLLTEAINAFAAHEDYASMDNITALIRGQREGRLVVLPVAIGSTVYSIHTGEVTEHCVAKYTCIKDVPWLVTHCVDGTEISSRYHPVYADRESAEDFLAKLKSGHSQLEV